MHLPVTVGTKTLLSILLIVTIIILIFVYLSHQFDSRLYAASRDKDRTSLFASQRHEILIRLIQRRQITSLDKKENSILKKAGLTCRELKDVGFTAEDLKDIGFSARDVLRHYSPADLRLAFDISEFEGFDCRELHNLGYTIKDIREAGFTADQMEDRNFTAKELYEGGYSIPQLMQAGFQNHDLIDAGVSLDVLANYCDVKELVDEGADAELLADLGFKFETLRDSFTKSQLDVAGFEKELKEMENEEIQKLVKLGVKSHGNILNIIHHDSPEQVDKIDSYDAPFLSKRGPASRFTFDEPHDPFQISFTSVIDVSTPPMTPRVPHPKNLRRVTPLNFEDDAMSTNSSYSKRPSPSGPLPPPSLRQITPLSDEVNLRTPSYSKRSTPGRSYSHVRKLTPLDKHDDSLSCRTPSYSKRNSPNNLNVPETKQKKIIHRNWKVQGITISDCSLSSSFDVLDPIDNLQLDGGKTPRRLRKGTKGQYGISCFLYE